MWQSSWYSNPISVVKYWSPGFSLESASSRLQAWTPAYNWCEVLESRLQPGERFVQATSLDSGIQFSIGLL